MLTVGALLFGIGLVLIFFNTVSLSFVKDQLKDRKQIVAGIIMVVVSIPILYFSLQNILNE